LAKRNSLKGASPITTTVTYLYRDAGNWKFWGEFNVLGTLGFDDLRSYLLDEEFFIPEPIGLPSLVPAVRNTDDHLLHTFEEFVSGTADFYACTAQEFARRVRAVNGQGWFASFV
jgi:hypothetical protein